MEKKGSGNYFRAFYIRRACRILPLYLVSVLAFFFVLALLVRGWILPTPPDRIFDVFFADPFPMWSYLTFTQNFAAAYENWFGPGGLAAVWSLAVEEQFVLILPLLVAFVPERWLHYVLVVSILAAPILRAGLVVSLDWPRIPSFVLLLTRADALFLGVLCAWLVRVPGRSKPLQGRRSGVYAILAVLTGGAIWALALSPFNTGLAAPVRVTLGGTLVALFFAFLLLVAVTERRGPISYLARLKLFRKLAPIAYGAFLFHYPVLGLAWWLVLEEGLLTGPWASEMARTGALILTFALATASWVLFEKRIATWGRSFKYERREIGTPDVTVIKT